jgi:hypothetical protein
MGGLKLTLETLGRLGIVGLAEQGVAMTPEPDYAASRPIRRIRPFASV